MYAFVGDIHLGTKLEWMDYFKSLEKFLEIIKEHKEPCHGIFICGDLFDHRLSVNDLNKAALFLIRIACNECGKGHRRHVPVYIIHGTYTHDYQQMDIFLPMLNKLDSVEIYYYDEACWGTMKNGTKVLFLPQEYGDVYYDELFSGQYDIIVGHGPISSETKAPCKSTQYEIMHSAEQLGSISKLCVFGHYHGYTEFGNNVFYTGPWLRWKYGEEEDRVFFICNDNFEVTTYPNDIAKEYSTHLIYATEELRQALSKPIESPHRFIIHCTSKELPEYHGIMNAYKKNPNIKYQIVSTDPKEEKVDIPVLDKHNTSPNVEPVPALIAYINDKYNVDTTQEIKEYEDKINRRESE